MGRRGAHKRQVRLCVCCHSSRGSRARLGFLKCACCGALTHDLPTQALRQEAQAGSCARFAGRGRAAATATQRLPATSGSQHQRAAAGSGSSSSDSSDGGAHTPAGRPRRPGPARPQPPAWLQGSLAGGGRRRWAHALHATCAYQGRHLAPTARHPSILTPPGKRRLARAQDGIRALRRVVQGAGVATVGCHRLLVGRRQLGDGAVGRIGAGGCKGRGGCRGGASGGTAALDAQQGARSGEAEGSGMPHRAPAARTVGQRFGSGHHQHGSERLGNELRGGQGGGRAVAATAALRARALGGASLQGQPHGHAQAVCWPRPAGPAGTHPPEQRRWPLGGRAGGCTGRTPCSPPRPRCRPRRCPGAGPAAGEEEGRREECVRVSGWPGAQRQSHER